MASREKRKNRDLFHYLKVVAVILFFVLLIVVSVFSYRVGVQIFTNSGVSTEEEAVAYTLYVEKGESVFQIGRDLEDHGIINSALVFWIQSKLYKCKIAPGEYHVSSSSSSKAILKYLNNEYTKAIDAVNKP